MELLLALAFLYGCLAVVPRVLSDAVATARASKAGNWDFIEKDRARRAARRDRWADAWTQRRTARHEKVGGQGDPGPGLRRYTGLVWRGFWQDQERKHHARRDMRGPLPVTLRAKWARAAQNWAERAKKRSPVDGDKPGQDAGGPAAVRRDGTTQPPSPSPANSSSTPQRPGVVPHGPNGHGGGDAAKPAAPPPPNGVKTPPGSGSGGPKPMSMKPLVPSEQERKQMNGTQGMSLGGETAGVVSGLAKAQKIKLAVVGLRESMLAQLDNLQKAVEENAAGASELEMDPATQADVAQAQEALAAAKASVTSACEEVDAAMAAVERDWGKHQSGVEFNSSVGGMAKKHAYSGN